MLPVLTPHSLFHRGLCDPAGLLWFPEDPNSGVHSYKCSYSQNHLARSFSLYLLNVLFVCVLCVWVCAHDCKCPRKQELLYLPRAGITGGCKLLDVAVGNGFGSFASAICAISPVPFWFFSVTNVIRKSALFCGSLYCGVSVWDLNGSIEYVHACYLHIENGKVFIYNAHSHDIKNKVC